MNKNIVGFKTLVFYFDTAGCIQIDGNDNLEWFLLL